MVRKRVWGWRMSCLYRAISKGSAGSISLVRILCYFGLCAQFNMKYLNTYTRLVVICGYSSGLEAFSSPEVP